MHSTPILLATLLFLTVCSCSDQGDKAKAEPAEAIPSPWANEEEWIAMSIAQRITELSGANEQIPISKSPEGDYLYSDHSGAETVLQWNPHIWAPELWAKVAAPKIEGTAVATSAITLPRIELWLKADAAIYRRANLSLTSALAEHPNSPDLHDHAALLIGIHALREAAGPLDDTRAHLSRMCAHLAVADAFSQGIDPSPVGQIARSLLDALAGRSAAALTRLDAAAVAIDQAGLGAWDRILRMYALEDWRILELPLKATPLEQVAFSRALMIRSGPDGVERFLGELDDPPFIPDWMRLLITRAMIDKYSVGAGHMVRENLLALEIHTTASYLGIPIDEDSDELPLEDVFKRVTEPLDKEAEARILPDSLFIDSFQRHALSYASAVYHHMLSSWGVPEDARAWQQETEAIFSALPLFPAVSFNWREKMSPTTEDRRQFAALCKTRPELVSSCLWSLPEMRASGIQGWFSTELENTAYNLPYRYMAQHMRARFTKNLPNYRKISPHSSVLAYAASYKPSNEQGKRIREHYGDQLSIDIRGLRLLRGTQSPGTPEYLETLKLMTDIDPTWLNRLGEFLAIDGQDDEARKAYLKLYEQPTNQVATANAMDWLVRHLVDLGDLKKAGEVAEFCAQVYSYKGLRTAAGFLLEVDEPERAMETALALAERYDDNLPAIQIYLNAPESFAGKKFADIRETAEAHEAAVFPNGRQSEESEYPDTRPSEGVLCQNESAKLTTFGMRKGDIIIAINNIAVSDWEQYDAALSMRFSPNHRFTFWRNGEGVKTLTGALPNRKFGIDTAPVNKSP